MSTSLRFRGGLRGGLLCAALAWTGACGNPDPVVRDDGQPRTVPDWYKERPVDPRQSTKDPLEGSSAGEQAQGPASGRRGQPRPQAEAEAEPETPAPESDASDPVAAGGEAAGAEAAADPPTAVPYAPIVPGMPTAFEGLPFEVPPIPAYRVPAAKDCDWIVSEGVARSTRGLDAIRAADHDGYVLGPAYRASTAARRGRGDLAPGRPVTIGVLDDAGEGVMGGGWSLHSPRSVFSKSAAGGFDDIRIEIVGLTPSCEVSVSWDSRWGKPAYIGLFNIGIRGRKDSFIIRANGGIGRLIMDGCWWLPAKEFTATKERHASGMHIDKWGELIWRNHKWRGVQPGTPGINLREHSAYLKSAQGGTWIVNNDLRGGNRTGFQIRPEPAHNEAPSGAVVIAGNYADGYGWNNGSDPSSFDGGSCITVWSNPNAATYVVNNRIIDAKYGCLAITAQGPGLDYLGEAGFPIGPVYVYGNTFENGRAKRDVAAITSTQAVHLYANEITGRLILNDTWPMKRHGIANGAVYVHDPATLQLDLWSWNGKAQKIQPVPPARSKKWLREAAELAEQEAEAAADGTGGADEGPIEK